MKRALPAILLIAVALPAAAAEKWWEAYNRGVNAVRAKSYEAGAEALQRAIAETPNESGSARARNEIITYVPHFWLGIAKFNLGDVDGALREWKTSEDQGAVQTTPYYAQLREWVARAQAQKQRNSENAAADSKREANAAVGRAVSAQMDAVSAGADRTDAYRAAQRKLQEAVDTAGAAGTDIRAYRRAADIAQQAHDLFAGAAEEAKRQKASRPITVPRQQSPPSVKRETVIQVPVEQPPQPKPQPVPVVQPPPPPMPQPQPAPVPVPAPIVQPPPAPALVAVSTPSAAKSKTVEVTAHIDDMRGQLETAYRAYAAGDLAASDQLLTRILAARQSGEAYLLRGCTRYTRAMLARKADPLLASATADFRTALKLNRALRLDPAAFSPKLIAFFEQVKRGT